jgi:hypothetical protein
MCLVYAGSRHFTVGGDLVTDDGEIEWQGWTEDQMSEDDHDLHGDALILSLDNRQCRVHLRPTKVTTTPARARDHIQYALDKDGNRRKKLP